MVDFLINAKILEDTMYHDLFTVKRKIKVKNEVTGVTEYIETVIAENVKCALSKKDNQTMGTDGVGKLAFSHVLFCNPSVDIKEGDTIELNRMNEISICLASKPFIYLSHKEIPITFKDRV